MKTKIILFAAVLTLNFSLFTFHSSFSQKVGITTTGVVYSIPDTSRTTSYCWGKGKMFDGFDPAKEIISKREMNSKHFRNDDGSYTAVISIGTVHYKDENGLWQEIDSRITETKNNSSYKFCNEANSFKNYFPADLKSNKGVKMKFNEGEVSDWLNPGFCWIDNNGNIISYTNHNDVDGIINENTISYASVFNGTDVKFTQKNDGKKMDIIIADNSLLNSVPTNAKYLAFYETIQIPSGWKVVTNNNSMSNSENFNNNDTIRTIRLYDSKGKAIVEYTTPYFYDNGNNYLNKLLYGFYKIEQNKDELIIYTFVPVTWLTSSDREFPITIDPTTTFYPDNAAQWTGGIGTTPLACLGSLVFAGPPACCVGTCSSTPGEERGWARFNISSISGMTVTNSLLNFNVLGYCDGGQGAITVDYYRDGTQDPLNYCTNPVGFWPFLRSGTQYVNNTPWPNGGWTGDVDLGATADADIQAAAVAPGWFHISTSSDCATPDAAQAWGYTGGADAPKLTVTYTVPCTPPSITTQPASPASICSGGSATITGLAAAGTAPLSYQWQYFSGTWNNVVNGTPAGATYSNQITSSMTVSGITAAGSYQYNCYITNACGNVTSAAVTVTVTPNNTITLTAGGTQTKCINTAITTTTYTTTGATGATITGLPAGVTGNWAANTVTISGTPTASGSFNYTITLTGGCP